MLAPLTRSPSLSGAQSGAVQTGTKKGLGDGRRADVWLDGLLDGWMAGWMDGRMVGWMDEIE